MYKIYTYLQMTETSKPHAHPFSKFLTYKGEHLRSDLGGMEAGAIRFYISIPVRSRVPEITDPDINVSVSVVVDGRGEKCTINIMNSCWERCLFFQEYEFEARHLVRHLSRHTSEYPDTCFEPVKALFVKYGGEIARMEKVYHSVWSDDRKRSDLPILPGLDRYDSLDRIITARLVTQIGGVTNSGIVAIVSDPHGEPILTEHIGLFNSMVSTQNITDVLRDSKNVMSTISLWYSCET